jgi:hypothetical protein
MKSTAWAYGAAPRATHGRGFFVGINFCCTLPARTSALKSSGVRLRGKRASGTAFYYPNFLYTVPVQHFF